MAVATGLPRRTLALALTLCLALLLAAGTRAQTQSRAQPPSSDAPFLLTADELIYNREGETVEARGSVEISSENRVLMADRVSYSQSDGTVTADGNITLLEPTGEVAFADHMALDAELKTGFIDSVRLLLTDKSRLAANRAERLSEFRTELSKAVYSPCELCPEDPDRPPLWQIKAIKVVHKRKAQTIEYRDAFLEVYGIPIAYTPYFQHPDPTVDRKTGLLTPTFGSSSDLGFTVQTPFYYVISPHRDVTLSPLYTSKEGPVMAAEYRAKTEGGGYDLSGSITRPHRRDDNNKQLDDREIRGHIKGAGRFDLDPTWRWGFDLFRSTDDTYLERYNFAGDDTLTSDIFLEGFRGTRYAAASAYSFQGLQVDDRPGETPLVAPLLEYASIIQPFDGRARLHFDADAVSLQRSEGQDTRRLSFDTMFRAPQIGPAGDVWTVIGTLGGDLYWLNDFVNPGRPDLQGTSDAEFRLTPQLALDWRLPLIRQEGSVRQLIEPIVQVVAAPYGSNPAELPNEDSLSVEFDDTNLFSLNRFPGQDRVESGHRANIGVKLGAYGESGGYTTATFGQVFRLKEDDTFARRSGLRDDRSDYVAGLTIAPSSIFDLTGRIRLDSRNLALRRNEVYLAVGPSWFRFNTSYIKLSRDQTVNELDNREEMYNALTWKFARYWTAAAESRRDLTGTGDQIRAGAALSYEDECIGFTASIERSFTQDRDVRPSTSFNIRFMLRNLG